MDGLIVSPRILVASRHRSGTARSRGDLAEAAGAEGLALVQRLDLGEFVGVGFDEIGDRQSSAPRAAGVISAQSRRTSAAAAAETAASASAGRRGRARPAACRLAGSCVSKWLAPSTQTPSMSSLFGPPVRKRRAPPSSEPWGAGSGSRTCLQEAGGGERPAQDRMIAGAAAMLPSRAAATAAASALGVGGEETCERRHHAGAQ